MPNVEAAPRHKDCSCRGARPPLALPSVQGRFCCCSADASPLEPVGTPRLIRPEVYRGSGARGSRSGSRGLPRGCAGYRAGVDFESQDPPSDGSSVQAAVDAAAQAYRAHGIDDVEDRVRSELAARGVEIDDEIWLHEVADMIRDDVPVFIAGAGEFEPDTPEPR